MVVGTSDLFSHDVFVTGLKSNIKKSLMVLVPARGVVRENFLNKIIWELFNKSKKPPNFILKE